tara:strand:+ start:296 stop:913 length:618 start_codon:yes stop_codon:yes gene_type:complete
MMNWLNNYDDMLNEISQLDLGLSLNYVIYVIQLLSPLIVFTFNDDGFLIEKNINIGMISIESKEFQYILQFDVINDINNEMVSQKKNLDDLNKKIINEYNELGRKIHEHVKKYGNEPYYQGSKREQYTNKEYQKFIKKYFGSPNIRVNHNGFKIATVFKDYYVSKYDKKMNKYIKMIDEIKKISENDNKVLNDIQNYLECKYNQL